MEDMVEIFKKIAIINELCNIPYDAGKNFISVSLRLPRLVSGNIIFGFNYKMPDGEIYFYNLDECIEQIENLKRAYYR